MPAIEPVTLLSTAVVVLAAAVAALAYLLWSQARSEQAEWTELDRQDWREDGFAQMLAHLTFGHASDGNAAGLFQNGAFWDEAESAIRSARRTVHFETFLWETGELSERLTGALVDRAERGVDVRMVIDAEGGKRMAPDERDRLRDAGVELHFFRPRTFAHFGSYNERDHRKLIVIDSRAAYIGGHCVSDDWLGEAQDRDHFRDMSLRLEGPVVNQIQAAFAENWVDVTGRLLADPCLFPAQERAGDATVSAAFIAGNRRVSAVQTLYVLATEAAQHTLDIMNPYFIPDRGAEEALRRAVERGVRVRVMTPTPEASDAQIAAHASLKKIPELIDAGVDVYGYERTLLHQKVLVVDGAWVVVGSTNFDPRSFDINEEISVSVRDASLSREIAASFEADLEHCVRYRADEVRDRPPPARLADRMLWRIRGQL